MISDDDIDLTNALVACIKTFISTYPDLDCSDGLSLRCDR